MLPMIRFDMGFTSSTWNFFEASIVKGAPDGVDSSLKRLANSFVGYGHDIDPKDFFNILSNNSTGIKMFWIDEKEIQDVSLKLPNNVLTIKGMLMLHQILTHEKGQVSYREASCFCKNNCWNKATMCSCQFKQKNLSFLDNSKTKSKNDPACTKKTPTKKQKLNVEDVYSSDSSDEGHFSVKDSTDDDDIDLQNLIEESDEEVIMEDPDVHKIQHGTHVLVQFVGGIRKSIKYKYVAICQGNVEEDGEVQVTCLNVVSRSSAKVFKINENDTSYVDFDQIVGILPNPKVKMQGNRVLYEFDKKVDVFERC